MHGPYPGELRVRVIGFVEGGGSRREAAEQFDVSVSSAISVLFVAVAFVLPLLMKMRRTVATLVPSVYRLLETISNALRKARATNGAAALP